MYQFNEEFEYSASIKSKFQENNKLLVEKELFKIKNKVQENNKLLV